MDSFSKGPATWVKLAIPPNGTVESGIPHVVFWIHDLDFLTKWSKK